MSKPEILSIFELLKRFPTEDSARLYFEGQRWAANGPFCAHCGSFNVVEVKDHKPMPYRCRDCRKHFSVRTGTVLEESRLPLQKWLMAIYMMTTARKGIPSTQMAKELGITQKSAWFLSQRIREAWLGRESEEPSGGGQLGGELEVDETFIGGKESNKHASKKLNKGRGTVGKSIVIGMKQRDGSIIAKTIPNTSKATLQGFIHQYAVPGSVVYTDTHSSYKGIQFDHYAVNHTVGEYVRDQAHTNGIESFWALLKRGHYGVFHYMSAKHL
ncbi:MAG TPA: IS1595 family transposase, partial [Burkholderiaceae bacterium]